MGKVAVIFPGQGAQYVGMGQEIFQNLEESKKVFLNADQALKYPLSEICFNGPEEELKKTEITQPALLTVCTALWEALSQRGIKPDATAGLSLGEYSSLVASGVLDFEEAVKLVEKRGKFMQEAVPLGKGTMAAIIGLSEEQVKQICQQVDGIAEPANFNCPGQIVIGGEVEAIEEACQLATEMGAKKAVVLAVSAPFHTSMLQPAKIQLAQELQNEIVKEAEIPIVSSVTGEYITNIAEIPDLLADQVCKTVEWEKSMRTLLNDGFDTFIEIGPGKTLKGFMRRIDRSAKVLNVYDLETLNTAVETLEAM